jgi:hypothetical protein
MRLDTLAAGNELVMDALDAAATVHTGAGTPKAGKALATLKQDEGYVLDLAARLDILGAVLVHLTPTPGGFAKAYTRMVERSGVEIADTRTGRLGRLRARARLALLARYEFKDAQAHMAALTAPARAALVLRRDEEKRLSARFPAVVDSLKR